MVQAFLEKNGNLHGAVEIWDQKNRNVFRVNGQRLKPFLTGEPETHVDTMMGLLNLFYE